MYCSFTNLLKPTGLQSLKELRTILYIFWQAQTKKKTAYYLSLMQLLNP